MEDDDMILQSSDGGCGKAVVRNYLSLLFKNKDYECAERKGDCKDFLSLKEEFSSYGVERDAYQRRELKELKKEELPAIAQVRSGEKTHFILVLKRKKGKILVLDPGFGKRWLKEKEADEIFLGHVLVPKKVEEKRKPAGLSLLPLSAQRLYLLFFLLRTVSLCLSLFFFGQEKGRLLSLCFFTLFRVGNALLLFLPLSLRKGFEKKRRLPYLDWTREKNDRASLSKAFQREVNRYSTAVIRANSALAIAFLLLFDSLFSSFLVLISLLFSFFRFLLGKRKAYVDYLCSKKEREFVTSFSEKERDRKKYDEAEKKASSYLGESLLLTLREVRSLATRLLRVTKREESFSLPYFLFRLGSILSFSFITGRILSREKRRREEKRLRNSLSRPLSQFIRGKQRKMGYNKKTPGGNSNGKEADQGLPEQDRN